MLTDRLAYLASTVLFLLAFIFQGGAHSNVPWIAAAFGPWAPLVYLFVFVGALVLVYAYTNSIRWGLALALLGVVGYWIWTTGAVLGWF